MDAVILLYIQIHLMFLFIGSQSRNTRPVHQFKYISCSYLSDTGENYEYTETIFKYISCSYLSDVPTDVWRHGRAIQIHLMFLFIAISLRYFKSSSDSNTSHVLIYLICALVFVVSPIIQIHLMFLFIYCQEPTGR